jgi:NADPH-dependent curcumin reductase CurA
MTDTTENTRILLASRPHGEPTSDSFGIESVSIPEPGEGEVLLRTIYLSLDPYMRGRMSAAKSYAAPVEIGAVMEGGTVAEVVESRDDSLRPGDLVLSYVGWQAYGVASAKHVRTLDPAQAPVSTALGVLGMPGLTAYVGLLDIGQPRAGETVVVSAASGAVGAVVGQIAKLKGCRVVGVAGSAEKCAYVVHELGFDACVDHHTQALDAALHDACPGGIDVYFENVGGATLAAVLPLINVGARIPHCGLISEYNATAPPSGPNLRPLLFNRALIKGFIISDHLDRMGDFLRDCSAWLREGKLKYREDVVRGLDAAPAAFIGLLQGKNFGKLVVEVGSRGVG